LAQSAAAARRIGVKRRLVVMSGLPASGKSTTARALGEALGWPVICKDALLHVIYEAMGFGPDEREHSLRTGNAAWAVFWLQARSFPNAVLDTNLKPTSAYEMAQLAALDAQLVEVACLCPPALAQARYAARPGYAAQRTAVLSDERVAEYQGSLGIADRIELDTTAPIDAGALAAEVRRRFATP
jgi:glucokinase